MQRTMTVRLYPSETQAVRLAHYLDVGRWIFNRALALKRRVWQDRQIVLTRFDLTKVLSLWRANEAELADVPIRLGRDSIRRVDLAFQHFFRRVKEKNGKAGYPRFKRSGRYNSFALSQPGSVIVNERIRVSGIGLIRCRNLRAVNGAIKQLRVVRRADRWFAQLVIDTPDVPIAERPLLNMAGFDLGLENYLVGSDGFTVSPPKFYRKLERDLRRAGRAASRKKKGSANRRKAVGRLQRVHLAISDARSNFTHHLSKEIVAKYDLIAVEKLNIDGMVRSLRLAKSILDAAWSQFLRQLRYKAESAGALVVEVDPRGTSQECSQCHQNVPKELSVRVHDCPHCGFKTGRDHNAALNILKRATAGRAESHACGDRGCAVVEAGSPTKDATFQF